MGTSSEEGIFHYYIFQQKLLLYLSGGTYKKDIDKLKEGYILNLEWVKNWKKRINYNEIERYMKKYGAEKKKIDSDKKKDIYKFITKCINDNKQYYSNTSFFPKSEYLQVQEKILTENYLQRIINKKIFGTLNIPAKEENIIQYIFKKKMMILFFPYNKIIKMIISDLSPYLNEKKIVNLTFIFKKTKYFESYQKDFIKDTSEKIINFILVNEILNQSIISYTDQKKNEEIIEIINEEQYVSEINLRKNIINSKSPQEINFSLIQRPSYRGLDNVGATCYMNATLQCLANIRPITEHLLNPKKYQEIYNNSNICRLTLDYCQVLIGLFCNNSNIGSYKPEDFKETIGELNSLFQGVQANDSKDLIIFLLETFNNELVKLHNKKYNIQPIENEINFQLDPTDEKAVFNEFTKDFNRNYYTTVGFNLCGFQKNIFICKCGAVSNNFSIFNFLIFGLETISNYFNLSNNNTQLPIITFDHCFNYLSKKEIFEQTYCQKCKQTLNAIYQEGIYMMPSYLIIILNRGKGNTFNCKVDIPEKFSSANYELIEKNNVFELVGIVSHLGESGMGGHFIAFCKHSLDNKWRIYNDSVVVECQNDYLTKGTPYILFYKNLSANKSQNNNQNNINNPNPIFNNNFREIKNMNFQNQQQQANFPTNNMNNINNPQHNMQNMNMNNMNNPQQNMQNMNMNNMNNSQQNIQNMNIIMNNSNNQWQNMQNMNMNNANNLQQNMLMINNAQANINNQQNFNMNSFNNGNINMNLQMNINQNMMNNNNGFQSNNMNMNMNQNM